MSRPLSRYQAKRDFSITAEPRGTPHQGKSHRAPEFVVQKHAASHLHYDLRLELDGVMKSWAVPKGPSNDASVNRLAMEVEDHPIEYNSFEGNIPKGQYGGGTVMLWDRGTYTPTELEPGESSEHAVRRQLSAGKLSFEFRGSRLRGAYTLIRTKDGDKPQWILRKQRDEFMVEGGDIVAEHDTSVESGRTMDEIAAADGVWHSNRSTDAMQEMLDQFEQSALAPMVPGGSEALDEGWWVIEPFSDAPRVFVIAADGVGRIVTTTGESKPVASHLAETVANFAERRAAPLVADAMIVGEGDLARIVLIDLLLDDRELLVSAPFIERRERLEAIAEEIGSPHLTATPIRYAAAGEVAVALRELQVEQGVARRLDSDYVAGSNPHWHRVTTSATSRANNGAPPVELRSGRERSSRIPTGVNDASIDIDGKEVALSNLKKPFWPGVTKGDLLRYYERVAPVLVPHLVDRAMVMKRYPHGASGEHFFMKRAPTPRPDWVETCAIEHASGSVIDFPMVQDLASLLWVVNLGCIDLNPWYSRCDNTDRPDFLHFDLDPVPNAGFDRVRETALALRELLSELDLPSYPKTSGSKGIHIYVPITRGPVQKQVWALAKDIANEMATRHPALVTAEYRIAKRPRNRVLVDYNQNAWGRTLASIYSVRPRDQATVSTPVSWDEIEQGVETRMFTIETVPDRIDELGDLWAPVIADDTCVSIEHLV